MLEQKEIEISYKGVATSKIQELIKAIPNLPVSQKPKPVSVAAGAEIAFISIALGPFAKWFFEEAGKDLWLKWKPTLMTIFAHIKQSPYKHKTLHIDFEYKAEGFKIVAPLWITSESEGQDPFKSMRDPLKAMREISFIIDDMAKKGELPASSGEFRFIYEPFFKGIWIPNAFTTYNPQRFHSANAPHLQKFYYVDEKWVEVSASNP
jgi:hypothetical protein